MIHQPSVGHHLRWISAWGEGSRSCVVIIVVVAVVTCRRQGCCCRCCRSLFQLVPVRIRVLIWHRRGRSNIDFVIAGIIRIRTVFPIPLRSGFVVCKRRDIRSVSVGSSHLESVGSTARTVSWEVPPAQHHHQDEGCREDDSSNDSDQNNCQWKRGWKKWIKKKLFPMIYWGKCGDWK